MPWWAKIGAKVVLSRVPVPYGVWRRLGIFRHGDMGRPEHAAKVFETHYRRALRYVALQPGFVALELGPGDSLLSGLVARYRGASRTYLVDTGAFAARDLRPYRELIRMVNGCGCAPQEIPDGTDLDAIARMFHITYLTGGATSLAAVPDESIDFAWSHVVLEHIRRREFEPCMLELRRVMRKGAICSHTVDLRDHVGGAINNLRFSERVWESEFIARSGFYTNRLRRSEILKVFAAAGFQPLMVEPLSWQSLPTPRRSLADPFREMHDDELLVAQFDVVLRAW